MNKQHSISAAILLLITFWCSDVLAAQYFPDDLDMPAREKQGFVSDNSELLESMKEPSLWLLAKDPKNISYRLIQSQGMKKHRRRQWTVLRLDRNTKMTWVLTVKQTSEEESKVNRTRRLSHWGRAE
jgi:hypothetical protein